MADADEASSLLIARLLQEDNVYAAIAHDGIDSSSDGDSEGYGYKKRKKRKTKTPVVVRTVKKKVVAEEPTDMDVDDDGKGKKRAKPKPWSDEEEKLFVEALELYGRDWKKHAEHLGNSREPRGIASHAQKYFIKLYKEDKPLPDKVLESGAGYTLSGKPLDPNSAAARAYGLHGTEGQKTYREKNAAKKLEPGVNGKTGPLNHKSLKNLIDAQLVDPEGPGLMMTYKDNVWTATVDCDGVITHEGEKYSSPSAFSIAMKRTVTPSKKADDGWKSITYNGITLDALAGKLTPEEPAAVTVAEANPMDSPATVDDASEVSTAPEIAEVEIAAPEEVPAKTEEPAQEQTNTESAETAPVTDEEEVDLSKLTARARNDALLAKMKAQGVKLNQVVDGDESHRAPRKDMEAESKKKEEEAARREAAQKAKQEREIKKQQEAWEQQQLKMQQIYGEDGRTDYSRNRSRRKASTKFVTAPTDALQFVSTSCFQGAPVTGPRSQPFHVNVHSSVYVTVDLHSHMSTAEVMGFLAGHWDPSKLTITVVAAFPGRSMLDGATECEMDPVAEVNLRSTIESQGLQVVGWYHSHPTFQPVPSSCDVDNQTNYQALFHDSKARMEPFIALINSPYDIRLPSSRSQFSWFYVESPQTVKNVKRIESLIVCDNELSDTTMSIMKEIVREKDNSSSHSVDFRQIWRDDATMGAISFLNKLRSSLSYWLPPLVAQTRKAQLEEHSMVVSDTSTETANEEQIQVINSFIEDQILQNLVPK